jgi:hypothetical protein
VDLLHHPHHRIAAHNCLITHHGAPGINSAESHPPVHCARLRLASSVPGIVPTVLLLLPSKTLLKTLAASLRDRQTTLGHHQAVTDAGDETSLAIALWGRGWAQGQQPSVQHHQQHLSSTPAKRTRSHTLPRLSAGSSFVERQTRSTPQHSEA